MAKPVSEQIKNEVEAHLQQSYNRLIATIMRRLATKNEALSTPAFLLLVGKRTRLPLLRRIRLKSLLRGQELESESVKIPPIRSTRSIQGFIRRTKLTATNVAFTSATLLSIRFMR